MEYGIKQTGRYIFCANCSKLISDNGEYNCNFCSFCGNPLTIEGIERKEEEIEEIKKSIEKK